jgi:hypothetical protein
MDKKACFYCPEDDDRVPKLFEKDHIFGRNISKETVYACLNCHVKKTYYQNKFPVVIRRKSDNKLAKYLYGLVSGLATRRLIDERIIELCLLISQELKERGIIE